MLIEHLKESWTSHLGAVTGATTSLVNGNNILQSVLVGVLIYCITKLIGITMSKVWKEWK